MKTNIVANLHRLRKMFH